MQISLETLERLTAIHTTLSGTRAVRTYSDPLESIQDLIGHVAGQLKKDSEAEIKLAAQVQPPEATP